MWTSLCYSDVAFLYRERGFANDQVVYRDNPLEYPVLTGAVMQVSAYVVTVINKLHGADESNPDQMVIRKSVWFYDITAVLMALCACVVVVATAATVARRPWDGMLVAASPVLLLTATINWDLLAGALTALAVLAWTRERPIVAGILIGLGTATKLYPALLLGAIFLVAVRAPRRRAAMRDAAAATAAAAIVWIVVNLPVAVLAPAGWRSFYEFNAHRPADFGSSWFAIEVLAPNLLPRDLDPVVMVSALVVLALIGILVWTAPEPPRLAQVAFLAIAAFLLVNKVWSPQYTLWLLPFAVLARPRVRELMVWQINELIYFVSVWWYLASLFDPTDPLISDRGYAIAIMVRVAALIWFAGLVVRDVLRPELDPVRPFMTPAGPVSAVRGAALR
jgi:uncharacterized membrane protein